MKYEGGMRKKRLLGSSALVSLLDFFSRGENYLSPFTSRQTTRGGVEQIRRAGLNSPRVFRRINHRRATERKAKSRPLEVT